MLKRDDRPILMRTRLQSGWPYLVVYKTLQIGSTKQKARSLEDWTFLNQGADETCILTRSSSNYKDPWYVFSW